MNTYDDTSAYSTCFVQLLSLRVRAFCTISTEGHEPLVTAVGLRSRHSCEKWSIHMLTVGTVVILTLVRHFRLRIVL